MAALIKFLGLAGLVLTLLACTLSPVIPGALPTAQPAISEPLGAYTPVQQPGREPTGAVTLEETTPQASATAAVPVGEDISITLADLNKTITLKVGQRFLLNLGPDYIWTPVVANKRIVNQVVGITVIRGAQGVYQALAPGMTRLAASGDPTCRQQRPACTVRTRLYEVTVVVEK